MRDVYNPVERCWGILEKHWNGAKLTNSETMLAWAKSMTWKGIHPVVQLSQEVYEKGVSLSKQAMQAVEARLERNPMLPKWDILIVLAWYGEVLGNHAKVRHRSSEAPRARLLVRRRFTTENGESRRISAGRERLRVLAPTPAIR